ncbi:MAG: hypothetical protein K6E10_08095 [Eubacterium sp.]|nr:hypothetical protein [Eubacterium sp.]
MELKKDNSVDTEASNQAEAIDDIQPQDKRTSNNDFLNSEIIDDFDDVDMFGNKINHNPISNNYDGSNGDNSLHGAPENDPYMSGVGEYPAENDLPRRLNRKEFFNSPRNRKDRDYIIISSVIVIIASIVDAFRVDFWLSALEKQINMVNSLSETFGLGEEYYIDVHKIMTTQIVMTVIFVALGLGVLLFQSRGCAIIGFVLIFSDCIYLAVTSEKIHFPITLIAFAFSIVATIRFNKAWIEYDNGGWRRN